MKKIIILFSFQLAIFTILSLLPSLLIKERLLVTNTPNATNQLFNLDQNLFFEINYPYDNLSQISLELKNPGIINDQIYGLDIFDRENRLLHSESFSDRSVGDPSRLDLKFSSLSVDGGVIKILISTPPERQLPTLAIFLDKSNQPVYQLFGYPSPPNTVSSLIQFFSRLPHFYLSILFLLNLYLIIGHASKK
jgi:hypothetical protein